MKKDTPKKSNSKSRKKAMDIMYIVLFFTVCSAPMVLWSFAENTEPIGKTELTDAPTLMTEDGTLNTEFFSEFDDYFTDHLPLRPQLVSADNYLKSGILGGETANIITGKNGYVFSTETVDDYVGRCLSSRRIINIARTVKLMEDKAEATGNNFVFTVAPNKNSVYHEYMPIQYIQGEKNNLSLLTDELEELDVNYADLKSELIANKDAELYLKRDTHWNNLGALYGFNTIMSALGKEHTDYNGINYRYEKSWQGDLDKMLYPAANKTSYQYYFDIDCGDVMITMPNLGKNSNDTMEELMGDSEQHDTMIKTRNMNADGQLLMVRDSFGRGMLPFLVNNYRSTTITRSQPFNMSLLDEGSGIDIVYEIAERNLGNIVKSAPLMTAVKCDMPEITSTQESAKNTVQIQQTESYIKIYGVLDEEYFSDDSRIFITLSSEDDSVAYEAFPICESEALGIKDSDYGYSLYIPANLDMGKCELAAVVTNISGNKSTGVLCKINT